MTFSLPNLPAVTTSRRGRRLAALLGAVVLAVTAVTVSNTAQATAQSSSLRPGLGHRLAGGDFIGYFVTRDGRKVYCLNPTKAAPKAISLSAIRRYPGASSAVTAELAYALSTWGNARTAWQAAVESQVLNLLAGNASAVHRRSRALSRSTNIVVAAHVRAAKELRGPYSVVLGLPHQLLPGRSGAGAVRVRSAGGRSVAGVPVRLTSSRNGTVSRAVRTDAHGMATFRYTATDIGELHVVATAAGLPPDEMLTSRPRPGEQRMVSWQSRVAAQGTAAAEQTVGGFSNRYACTTACNGRPPVTLTACAAASSYASRIEYTMPGKLIQVPYPASSRRQCRSVSIAIPDGARVSAAWRFATARGWSRPVPARGTFVVDCPAVPAVTASMTYDCTAASVTIALGSRGANGTWTPLVNATRHRMVLVIGGATSTRIFADHGRTAVFTATAACGSPVTYTMQAGIQRSAGGYNYGSTATVTTPSTARTP